MCVCVSVWKREAALEAGAGGVDRERPAVVWQYATDERALAQPHARLPSARHTVPMLTHYILFLPFSSSFLQTQWIHLHTLLLNTCLCAQTHAHVTTQLAWLAKLDHKRTVKRVVSQLERNCTKALRLLNGCWSCMGQQLLLHGMNQVQV